MLSVLTMLLQRLQRIHRQLLKKRLLQIQLHLKVRRQLLREQNRMLLAGIRYQNHK